MNSIKYIGVIVWFLLISCSNESSDQNDINSYSTDNWMNEMLLRHASLDISLYDICIPRSHDAGMYRFPFCYLGGNACNVQTQDENIGQQLLDGIRNFDIRPLLRSTVYYTRHSIECDGLGCLGDRLDNMLEQVASFLENHAELVILDLGSWCYTNGNDPDLRLLIQQILGEYLYTESPLNPVSFIHRPLREIIPPEAKKGKVIVLASGVSNNDINRADGMFNPSFLPQKGNWSNAQKFLDLKTDQFEEFSNYSGTGNSLYELTWTLTQDFAQALSCLIPTDQSISIRKLADIANAELEVSVNELIATNQIRKGRIPNIIAVDFCAPFVTEECIKISLLNLE